MVQVDEVVKEFLIESQENLDRLDQDLVALEQDAGNHDILSRIFRSVHTIKGTCGFLGFARLESLTHAAESLLSLLRDGKKLMNPDIASALLGTVDAVRVMLAAIESSGADGDNDYADLVATLSRLQAAGDTRGASTPATAKARDTAAPKPAGAAPAAAAAPAVTTAPAPATAVAAPAVAPAPAAQVASPSSDTAVAPAAPDAEVHLDAADTTVRVDVALLDKLMNLVGEVVLARNQILQHTATQSDSGFLAISQRLNLTTTELQESVMKTRMQPIGNVWNKVPRVVRDLAHACGKQVRVEMNGKDTELDRTLLEAIRDPLTHVVRNCIDHGIESPEVRVAHGKPAEGRLTLHAYHESGQVNIEISDDGAGIDPERIRQKAVQKGIVSAEQAARMSEREVVDLIFLPGFSTAEKVSNVSGRGVGMDVVKTNIERIGGTVDILTTVGRGTTLKIKIPLTLAIIPALIVRCDGERYAIPQVNLLELVRLDGGQARGDVEMIHDVPVYRLRGNLLPLVYLDQVLGSRARGADAAGGDQITNIVVLQAGERRFGVVVDSIHDTEEIVVKPIGKHLKRIPVFAGATVLGDGQVALIADVLGLAQMAHVVSEEQGHAGGQAGGASDAAATDHRTLLVVQAGAEGRFAIPLSLVARLEEFQMSAIEHSEGRRVVQYRDEIMPIVPLEVLLGRSASQEQNAPDILQVVVYSAEGHSIGLIVDRIVDIVEVPGATLATVDASHVSAPMIVQGKVTELLDLSGLVGTAVGASTGLGDWIGVGG